MVKTLQSTLMPLLLVTRQLPSKLSNGLDSTQFDPASESSWRCACTGMCDGVWHQLCSAVPEVYDAAVVGLHPFSAV